MVAPGARKPKVKLDAVGLEAQRVHLEALALVEEQFRDFDVVWAKVHGFPWWPAILFHSWDAVRNAGIQADAKLMVSLVVPGPEQVPVLDAATGEETGAFRTKRHCLVMFLDKFNFSVVEMDQRSVGAFTTHYNLHVSAIMDKKHSKKTDFRRSLVKANEVLHMVREEGSELGVDWEDLVLLDKPTAAEKKRRVETSSGDDEASLEDAWDDQEEAFDIAEMESEADGDGDDGAYEEVVTSKGSKRKPSAVATRDRSQKPATSATADRKKRSASTKKAGKKADTMLKADTKASSSSSSGKRPTSQRVSVLETTEKDDDFDDTTLVLASTKARRKAPAKENRSKARKASRKEGLNAVDVAVVSPSPSPIDLTGIPDSDEKLPRARGKSTAQGNGSGKRLKPKKKKAGDDGPVAGTKKRKVRAKALVLEGDGASMNRVEPQNGHNEPISVSDGDKTDEEEGKRELVLTPLSSIWTTPVSADGSQDTTTQLAYRQDFVWDDAVFTDEHSIAEKEKASIEQKQAELAAAHAVPGRERALGKRQQRSVQQSQIRQNMMMGNLDPHTMVQCTAYRSKEQAENPNSRSRGSPNLDPPFRVVVHPDAVFVSDLHAHLATCEIIGFLGGKWDEASKTLYIQAAFPCRSLVIDGDDGSTDVEMDPGSEIELRGIIENAQLEVVGWYHSHPAFAPDPSVRDIENQASYQQLFQRTSVSKGADGKAEMSEPFVGLIVGTYDTRRDSPVGLFRYFHVRSEKVSGGARREIYMPYEFIPARRHFRRVLADEERQSMRLWPMYPSVFQHFALSQSLVKAPLPATDIQRSSQARGGTPKASPTRVKAEAPVRKRRQSADAAGDKSVKKMKGKCGRKLHVKPTTPSEIDLTGEDGEAMEGEGHIAEAGAVGASVIDIAGGEPMDVSGAPDTTGPLSDVKLDVEMEPPAVAAVATTTSSAGNVTPEKMISDAGSTKMKSDGDAASTSQAPKQKDVEYIGSKSNDGGVMSLSTAFATVTNENAHTNGAEVAKKPIETAVHTNGSKEMSTGIGVVFSTVMTTGETPGRLLKATQPPVHIVEPEVLEVIADVVVSTALSGSSDAIKRKKTRKNPHPQTSTERRSSLGGDGNTVDGADSARSVEMQTRTKELELKRDSQTLDTSSRHKTRKPVKQQGGARPELTANSTTANSVTVTSSTPAARSGDSSFASVGSGGSSGRRRNRKPRKTTKNNNRSSSPVEAGPSPGRSPSPPVPPTQTSGGFWGDVFQMAGPLVSQKESRSGQEITTSSEGVDDPKTGNLPAEDLKYIIVKDKDVPVAASSEHGAGSLAKDTAGTKETPASPQNDGNADKEEERGQGVVSVNKEVRNLVVALVDTVVAKCVPRVAAMSSGERKQRVLSQAGHVETAPPASQEAAKQTEKASVLKREVADGEVKCIIEDTRVSQKVKPSAQGSAALPRASPATISVSKMKHEAPRSLQPSESMPPVEEAANMEIVAEELRSEAAPAANLGQTSGSTSEVNSSDVATASQKKETPAIPQEAVKRMAGVLPVSKHEVVKGEMKRSSADTALPQGGNPPVQRGEAVLCAATPSPSLALTMKREALVAFKAPSSDLPVNGAVKKEQAKPLPAAKVASDQLVKKESNESIITKDEAMTVPISPQLFGSNGECEDIQTSLRKMARHLGELKTTQAEKLNLKAIFTLSGQATSNDATANAAPPSKAPPAVPEPTSEQEETISWQEQQKTHLQALRTKYGAGAEGCAEQVITLVDYYRDFERRTNLGEMWKARTNKLEKIEASLSEYVQYVSVPVVLRQAFIKDVIAYLRISWATKTERRRRTRVDEHDVDD
ncbi:hypothetical protein BBJ28_00015342 [Nothophytophthora sp. Chile5]|nr:hypothetical protein BBJ28_00015342 [Nothophytophthora sp. Chile5]